MAANLVDVALRLQCASPRCVCQKASSNGTLMRHCPAHDDAHPSLSLSETADRLLWKCQAGCSQTEVTQALKEKGIIGSARTNGSDHRRPNNKVHSGAHIPNGNQGHRVTNSKSSTAGLSTEALAKAKKLPMDLLRAWGVCDRRRDQVARVAMPYMDEDGNTIRVRYRLSLDADGQRFCWGSGNRTLLYGLNKLIEKLLKVHTIMCLR